MSTITLAPSAIRPHQLRAVPQRQLRLTRRGRLVVFLAALGVALLIGFFWGSGSVATERPGTPEPTRVVTVGSGDTLWGIAAELTTDGNVGAVVDRIERLNSLDSGMVVIGQKLRVPTTE